MSVRASLSMPTGSLCMHNPCRRAFLREFLMGCSFADAMASFIPRRAPVMEVMAFLVKRRMTARQVRLCPAGKEK